APPENQVGVYAVRLRDSRYRSPWSQGLLYDLALLLGAAQPPGAAPTTQGIRPHRLNDLNRCVHLRSKRTRTTCPSTRTRIIGEDSPRGYAVKTGRLPTPSADAKSYAAS